MNEKTKAALIGGVSFGIASALPYLEMINVVCCALYVAGGALASYLYLKTLPTPPATAPYKDPAPAPYKDGAVVGLLAGVFGGVAYALAATLLSMAGVGSEDAAQAIATMKQQGIEPPPFVLDMMGANGASMSMFFTALVVGVILFGIFGTLGGLLGVAIFTKKDA